MAGEIRFMNNNYLSRGFTYSSQATGYAAINAYDTQRSKLWKPNGNFEVTATDNVLWFNDGSNQSVTATAGTYTAASLATHLQALLNAASTNWTVTYSTTTYKFTIARSSGTAVLRLSVTTTDIWDVIGFVGVSDLSTSPFVADEPRIHTSEWLKCDNGVPQQATFAALIGPADETFTLSSNASVKIQGNNVDDWTAPPLDESLTLGNYSALKFFDDVSTASYRYHRLKIVDRQNPLGPSGIAAGFVYIGDHVTMSNTNIAPGFTKSLVDQTNVLQSINGAMYFDLKPRYLGLSGNQIQLIKDDEKDDLEQLFYDVGNRTPFFVSIDPSIAVTTSLEDLTRFVVMQSSSTFESVFRNYYNVRFDMREVV